jgi:hypothetical protein
LTDSVQKREKLKLQKILNRLFKYIIPAPSKKIEIRSWTFKDFDAARKFQVGKCYTLRPISITYNSTQQDYKYNKQIISEFYIEANGSIKKLVIIDSIKKEVVRREKFINGRKIHRQHYNLEIRNHRLNRSLMKAFLFHQIYKLSEYDQDSSPFHNTFDSKPKAKQSEATRSMPNVSLRAKEAALPRPKSPGRIPEEYITIPAGQIPSQNKEKMGEMDIVHGLQKRFGNDAIAKGHVKPHGIFEMKPDSVYAADGYYDSKSSDWLIIRVI